MNNYTCECGKQFTNPQSFNGHKSHCKIHFQLNGKLDKLAQIDKIRTKGFTLAARTRAANKNNTKEILWNSQKHFCEKCGKQFFQKFGSGRFCSRSCANSRCFSEETKSKIRETGKVKHRINFRHLQALSLYLSNPNYCCICGNILPYDKRNRKTCSDACKRQVYSKTIINTRETQGLLNKVKYRFKYGTYKGYECDSSWELAFVIYNLDHDIPFERCKEHFSYVYANKIHQFYPDFKIDGVYYEIKGRDSDITQSKIKCFPSHLILKVLFKDDIKLYVDYCIHNYGKNFTHLYERDKPSWLDWVD